MGTPKDNIEKAVDLEVNSDAPELRYETDPIGASLSLSIGPDGRNIYQSPAPSRPANKINIPEITSPKAKFIYNYFTRDERVRPDSVNEKDRLVILDAEETNEIFYRKKNKKLARFVQLEFSPPIVPAYLRPKFQIENTDFDLVDAMNKIVAEGTFSNEIFSGVEFIDTGRESKVYDMLNGFLFFAEIPAEKNSNRQRVEKLYETLSEKGGLFGQDKKIIFEAYKNFMSGNSTNSQYILAESDVPPEIAKFANDPLAKQTFSVQFNNLLMQEMVTAASIAPDNVFQDEIRALKPFSNRIRSELLGENIPPVHTYREIEYDLQVPAVKMIEIPNSLGSDKLRALKNEFPKIKFAGYLLEKYEILPDESVDFLGRQYIRRHDTNFAVDTEVRYGGAYFYKIRTVCQVEAVVHTAQPGRSYLAQSSIATVLMASEGKLVDVSCVERVPPPAPTNLRATFDFETLLPRISWQFPLNKQRDIKRFQIFKRLSINEPFVLLKEYDFDNSIVKSPVPEVALDKNIIKMKKPRTFFLDTSHNEGEKPIYAIACVDAHGMSSNYSPQLMVERDRYTNRAHRTVISRAGAPKPYPNLYLERDTFQDAIKVSGYDRIKLVLDPEYYRVVKNVEKRKGDRAFIEEKDLNFLAIDNKNFRYKFHFINIDNQLDQVVKVKLENKTSPNAGTEGAFETSVADLSETNLSFQYGVE